MTSLGYTVRLDYIEWRLDVGLPHGVADGLHYVTLIGVNGTRYTLQTNTVQLKKNRV
jgi:hypothetical protein